MVFVLFEVKVKEEGVKAYLALAAGLKTELERAEGFIRSKRFRSITDEGKILSLSIWESEEAVEKWRNTVKHRMSQRQGTIHCSKATRLRSRRKSGRTRSRTERKRRKIQKIFGSSSNQVALIDRGTKTTQNDEEPEKQARQKSCRAWVKQ
jgi:heme-degrading monooxygenase HmoA